MNSRERISFERRWASAIQRIGIGRLLLLPRKQKQLFADTTDLVCKTLLLEQRDCEKKSVNM